MVEEPVNYGFQLWPDHKPGVEYAWISNVDNMHDYFQEELLTMCFLWHSKSTVLPIKRVYELICGLGWFSCSKGL